MTWCYRCRDCDALRWSLTVDEETLRAVCPVCRSEDCTEVPLKDL